MTAAVTLYSKIDKSPQIYGKEEERERERAAKKKKKSQLLSVRLKVLWI